MVHFAPRMSLGTDSASYNLTGVVSHRGPTLLSGHYTANAKCEGGRWGFFNDAVVSDSEVEKAVNKHAYLVVYEREEKVGGVVLGGGGRGGKGGGGGRKGGKGKGRGGKKRPTSESTGAVAATGIMAAMLI